MARQGDNYYLVVNDTVTEDSGAYSAAAANMEGESKSYGRLNVSHQIGSSEASAGRSMMRSIEVEDVSISRSGSAGVPPEFRKLFYDKQVKLGDTVRLETIVFGSPKPKVNLFICLIF
jgi:hypothetical protein